jgi:hypothetical protein
VESDYLPSDLTALPTAPWAERPEELPLDTEECRTALWLCQGNISDAAEMLKVKSSRLRNFVKGSEYLIRELSEAAEVIKDIAEKNVVEALTDKGDSGRKDSMTRWFLERKAKDRGYGNAGSAKMGGLKGNITISWDIPDNENDQKTIEGTSSEVA